MKYYFFLILAVFAFLSIGCDNDELNIDSIQGSWVESSNLTDTLIFDSNEFEGWLSLNRGKEMRNDYMLPKIGSGLYDYKISGDSIQLQNLLMSCFCPKSYTFEILSDENSIKIGNFFNPDIPLGELLIFEKI